MYPVLCIVYFSWGPEASVRSYRLTDRQPAGVSNFFCPAVDDHKSDLYQTINHMK